MMTKEQILNNKFKEAGIKKGWLPESKQAVLDAMEEYAHPSREEKLEVIAKLFGKAMFYGDWEWETPNERTIEMLMCEVGYYPFKDEDEMIAKTQVDEDLYKQAIEAIPTRPPKSNNTQKQTVESSQ